MMGKQVPHRAFRPIRNDIDFCFWPFVVLVLGFCLEAEACVFPAARCPSSLLQQLKPHSRQWQILAQDDKP